VNDQAGAVCWVDLRGRSAAGLTCAANPMSGSVASGDRFGQAVAAGNVSAVDNYILPDSANALRDELVVGSPASFGPIAGIGSSYSPDIGGAGTVWVFRSESSGPRVHSAPSTSERHYFAALRPIPSLSTPGFGSALAVVDGKRNGRMDLLIGDDGPRSSVWLTEQRSQHGFEDDTRLGGFQDEQAHSWFVFKDRESRAGFVPREDASVILVDKNDETCAEVEFMQDFLHFPTLDHAEGASDGVFCVRPEDGGSQLMIYLSHEDDTPPEWIISFGASGCGGHHTSTVLSSIEGEEPKCEP